MEEMTELIARCLDGEGRAQEQLVLAVQDRVYYHCRKMLKNEQDALDVTQDILIAMLTNLGKLREPAAFWGWLSAMTANCCRKFLVKRGRESSAAENEKGESLLDSCEDPDEQTAPDKALDNDETRRMIMDLVDALPDAQRQCVLMFYYEEMRVREIAAALEITEGTVKSRLNYARRSIKAGVDRYTKDGVKLYSFSLLPFLAYFLRKDASVCGLSPEKAHTLTETVLRGAASAGGGAAAGSAAGAGSGMTAKVAAAGGAKILGGKGTLVLAGLVLAGIVGGAAFLHDRAAPEEEPLQTVVETNPTGDTAETEPPSGEIQRKAAYLEVLDHAGDQAMYARLIDMDGDGTEELLLFGQYRWAEADEMDWGFTAYTWDGAAARSVDLARGGMMIDCSAYGVYRDSTTGEIYVHYYSGMDEENNVFLSLTDRVRLRASSDPDAAQEYGMAIGGGTSGYDGDVTPITAEEYQQQLDRFVLVEDLGNWLDEKWYETSWAWLSFWNAYTTERPEYPVFYHTVDEVRQELQA